MESKKNTPKGVVFLITTAVIWGFAFVAQRVGSDNVGAFTFNGIRFFLGAISLIPVIMIFEKGAANPDRKKATLRAGICAGLLLGTATPLQQMGIELTASAGKSGFITGLYMILVPIIGIFVGKKTGILSWIGAVCGVAGLGLICFDGSSLTFTKGDIVLIISAFIFALHIMVIDRFGDNVYSLRFSMTQFAVSSVFNLIFAFITEDISASAISAAALPLAYCGFLSSGVAYTCQVIGQKYCEPTSASILLSTESVFAAIGGALILHERMAPLAYFGCALILVGILLSQLHPSKNG